MHLTKSDGKQVTFAFLFPVKIKQHLPCPFVLAFLWRRENDLQLSWSIPVYPTANFAAIVHQPPKGKLYIIITNPNKCRIVWKENPSKRTIHFT